MSLFVQIKDQNLAALKNGNKIERSVFTLILGEATRSGDPKAIPDDIQMLSVIRKIAAGVKEMMDKGAADPTLQDQLTLLESLTPQQASENDIIDFVGQFITSSETPLTQKDTGKVMGALKERFMGAYDGKLASGIVRSALSEIK